MSDAERTAVTPKKEPTASEAMFFFAIVKHTRNKADIDLDAVATEQNFKNAEVAKVRFGQVKRKLGISSNATDTPASTPRSGVKKRAGSAVATPTKAQKNAGRVGKGRARAKVKKEEPAADEDGGGDVSGTFKSEPLDPAAQFEKDMDSMIQEDDPF